MGKLGRRSCCGRDGSWFKKCGSANFDHTWYEGIQACKASLEQSQLGLGQPGLNPADQKRNHSSNGVGIIKSKKVITAALLKFMSANAPTRIPQAKSIVTPAYTRVNALIRSSTHLSADTPRSTTGSAQPPDTTSRTYDKGTAMTTFASTHTPTPMPAITTTHSSTSVSATRKGCKILLKTVVHSSLVLFLVF